MSATLEQTGTGAGTTDTPASLDADISATLTTLVSEKAKGGVPSAGEEKKKKSKDKKPRLCVILHGKRADQSDVRKAVRDVRALGFQVDIKVTWEEGDVDRFITDIVKDGKVDTVVAAGGDGTLNEVVAALLTAHVPRNALSVGLLPLGTSNDFAATTGMPKDLTQALLVAADPSTRHPVDVGLLNGGVFMNTSTLGASSELGAETSHEAKALLGPAAYLVKGVVRLTQYTSTPVTLRYPAEDADPRAPRHKQKVVVVREDLLNLTAGNNRQVASMLQPCPDALLDDGLLDITYVVGSPTQAAAGVVGEVFGFGGNNNNGSVASAAGGEGQARSGGSGTSNVRMLRVPWLEVESHGAELPANRDGEAVPQSTKFSYEVIPRRILLHLPDDRLLVSGAEAAGGDGDGAMQHVATPRIHHNRFRPGAIKEMWAKVVRFNRVIPGQQPLWLKAALSLARFTAAAGCGYALAYYHHVVKPNRQQQGEGRRQQWAGATGSSSGAAKRRSRDRKQASLATA